MVGRPVLLVIVGALGDWGLRRVIKHAQAFTDAAGVKLVLVDIRPREDIAKWVARRIIEQAAEGLDYVVIPVDDPSGMEVAVFLQLLWDPAAGARTSLTKDVRLPDPTNLQYQGTERGAIEEFFDQFVSAPTMVGLQSMGLLQSLSADVHQRAKAFVDRKKTEALQQFDSIMEFLTGRIDLNGQSIPRYWHSSQGGQLYALDGLAHWTTGNLNSLCDSYRVHVYAATPPHVYPEVLNVWSLCAHRIGFEKPIDGLLGPHAP
jgi:hypothetical protein